MRVKCLSDSVGSVQYRITLNKEYVVLGISHSIGKPTVNFWIKDDPGNYIVPTPRELFEVTDQKVSSYWIVKLEDDKILISAKEFLDPSFLEGLTNREDERVSTFRRVSSMLEDEANPLKH